MKVLFTLDDSITAGGGHAIYTHLQAINRPEQYLLICPPGELASLAGSYAAVETISLRKNKMVFALQLRRLLKAGRNIELLHVHGVSALPIAVMSRIGLKIPLEYTEHLYTKEYRLRNGVNNLFQKTMYFFLLRFVRHIYCVSNAVQMYITKHFLYPKKRTSVAYNVVPRYQTEPKDHSFSETVKLLSVGSLLPLKYFDGLIEVMRLLPECYQLQIIGEGSERQLLEHLISSYKLEFRVTLLGNIPHPEVIHSMNDSDIYCTTSKSESFGFTVAEAMAVGLPVVAFSVGGLPELVTHEETGLLVEPYDLTEYAEAVKRLGENFVLRAKYGKQGFRNIEKFQELLIPDLEVQNT